MRLQQRGHSCVSHHQLNSESRGLDNHVSQKIQGNMQGMKQSYSRQRGLELGQTRRNDNAKSVVDTKNAIDIDQGLAKV